MPQTTEAHAYGLIREHLQKIAYPVVFELGMCDGAHTKMLLSWCGDDPVYYGFEPDPRNVAKIIGNHEIMERIIFFPYAIGHVTKKVALHLSNCEPGATPAQSSISGFTPVLTQKWPWLWHLRDIKVQCWKLDDFCKENGIDRIDFLWMDVQGAERLVFDGAKKMLPNIKLLWTEYDDGTYYQDSSTLQDILARFPGWEVLADCGTDVLLRNPKV
jgi:FkbM family methyltransferase